MNDLWSQIMSGHFVGWHPQFCPTVDAQVWNWFCNHILFVYHPWHHTNRAIEIIDCFLSYWWPSFDSGVGPADHLQEFGIPVHRWERRNIFQKLEQKSQRQFPGTFLWAKTCRTTMAQELSRSQLTRFSIFPQTLLNVALSSKQWLMFFSLYRWCRLDTRTSQGCRLISMIINN